MCNCFVKMEAGGGSVECNSFSVHVTRGLDQLCKRNAKCSVRLQNYLSKQVSVRCKVTNKCNNIKLIAQFAKPCYNGDVPYTLDVNAAIK